MVCDGMENNCSAVARSGTADGGGARSDFSQKVGSLFVNRNEKVVPL